MNKNKILLVTDDTTLEGKISKLLSGAGLKLTIEQLSTNDYKSLHEDIRDLAKDIQEDLEKAKSVQKSLVPDKFESIEGLNVKHRYLSGMKSGSEYLDFFAFDNPRYVGVLMSDCNAYGLSSAFVSVIVKLALRLANPEKQSPLSTVKKIFQELKPALKTKDRFSIFYGVLDKQNFTFTYVGAGSIRFFHQAANKKKNKVADFSNQYFSAANEPKTSEDHIQLGAGDRLVLMSDGACSYFQNSQELAQIISEKQNENPLEVINETVFRVKQSFESEDDIPEEDVSVMVIDLDPNIVKMDRAK